MSTPQKPEGISEPFPIFTLAHKYLIYDPQVISHIREAHNICGVLIGSLPQAPQQNVFLGVPLELMPEEARLLVEKGAAYIIDDTKAHKSSFLDGALSAEEKKAYHEALRKRGTAVAEEAERRADERKQTALRKKSSQAEAVDWNDIPDDMLRPSMGPRKKSGTNHVPVTQDEAKIQKNVDDDESSLFGNTTSSQQQLSRRPNTTCTVEPYAITPTTSQPPLHFVDDHDQLLPPATTAYPLFKHVHSQGYFLAPGLRFGCQYMAYPGDPLRFHSHFLCSGMDWDQEFDLLDLIGGGRLGTGVKKGFLIGGRDASKSDNSADSGVRTFCIEWAGM